MAKTLLNFLNEFDAVGQGVAKVLNQASLVLPLLPIVSDAALVHNFKKETSQGGVASRELNSPYADTTNSVTVPAQERVGIMGASCKTDVRMEKSSAGQARGQEIARRSQVVGRYFDTQFFRGNGLTDQKELVGMRDRLTGSQLITAATNGAALTLTLFNQLIDNVDDYGGGRFVFLNRTLARKLKTLVTAAAGGASVADMLKVIPSYEDVSIIVTKKDHLGGELLDFNETCGSSNVTSSIYCVAAGPLTTDKAGVQTIMSSNSIEVINEGIRDSQYVDVVELCAGYAVYQDKAASRLKGITNA